MHKVQRNSSPIKDDKKIILARDLEAKYFDSFEAFWNLGKVKSTDLVKTFEQSASKTETEPVEVNRL